MQEAFLAVVGDIVKAEVTMGSVRKMHRPLIALAEPTHLTKIVQFWKWSLEKQPQTNGIYVKNLQAHMNGDFTDLVRAENL